MKNDKMRFVFSIIWLVLGLILVGLAFAGYVDAFWSGMGSALMAEGKSAVRSGHIITGTSAGCAVPFGLALVAALKGEEAAKTVAEQIVIR